MDLSNRVLVLLSQMIAIDSQTHTEKEKAVEDFLYDTLRCMGRPVEVHRFPVPEDSLERTVVTGFVPGSSKDTVLFLNHHDVVGSEDYGVLRDYAFRPEALLPKLQAYEKDSEVLADLASGEWMVGRGSCDMKGGAAAQLAVLEEYAHRAKRKLNLLFISVPDEESFSDGMRAAVTCLNEMKAAKGLDYKLLINCEPNNQEQGTQVAFTGSVGKLLPIVFVQGKPVHIGAYRQGLNPLGVLARIIVTTEGDESLCDKAGKETTPPPTWVYARDRKQQYDVSLPQRAAACANYLTYTKTPGDILQILTAAAKKAGAEALTHVDSGLDLPVFTFSELLKHAEDCEGFAAFYENARHKAKAQLEAGESTYVDATLMLVEQILDYTGFLDPLVVIGFAPPYYPAADSYTLEKDYYPEILQEIKNILPVRFEPYFNGISDCSYCSIAKDMDPAAVTTNMPLWGEGYGFDFQALQELAIPFLLLGPWGKDLHERTERVNVESVAKILPEILQHILEYLADR